MTKGKMVIANALKDHMYFCSGEIYFFNISHIYSDIMSILLAVTRAANFSFLYITIKYVFLVQGRVLFRNRWIR